MDWSSYFLGLATLPALAILLLAARRLLLKLTGGTTTHLRNLSGPSSAPSPLQFNRRVVGQLRHPSGAEESRARAS